MATTPDSLAEHAYKFEQHSWENYSVQELGNAVAFFMKRATHRRGSEKKSKDLDDAQNYLNMLQAKLDEIKAEVV